MVKFKGKSFGDGSKGKGPNKLYSKSSSSSRSSGSRSLKRSHGHSDYDRKAKSAKKDYHKKDYHRKSSKKSDSKPSGSGESNVSDYATWAAASDITRAESLVESVGLDVGMALRNQLLPQPARLAENVLSWRTVTNDTKILKIVGQGYRLQFLRSTPPPTPHRGRNPPCSQKPEAIKVIDKEVEAIVSKGAGHIVEPSEAEVVSGIFARPKKAEGKWRPIVNVKWLNKFISKIKFKMTKLSEVRKWLQPGFYCASIDLKDAYYSVGLHPSAWRFIRFRWRNILYEYRTLMFGLTSSPRIFTKVVCQVIKFLRSRFNIWIVAYLDDLLIQAADPETCMLHVQISILVLSILGFAVSFEKSSLKPSQDILYLGLLWNTADMSVRLPEDKLERVVSEAKQMLRSGSVSVRKLRSFLGFLESCKTAVPLAAYNYRNLQHLIKPFLRGGRSSTRSADGRSSSPQRRIALSAPAIGDLSFWRQMTRDSSVCGLLPVTHTTVIATDASGNFGYGGTSSSGGYHQGEWGPEMLDHSINFKEMFAAVECTKKLMNAGDRVLLQLDNRCCVSYVQRQGGTKSVSLNSLTRELWSVVLSRGGWVTAEWLPRDQNQTADLLSKCRFSSWEITLTPGTRELVFRTFFSPSLDLFASTTCHTTVPFCSLQRDPRSLGDSFFLPKWPDRAYGESSPSYRDNFSRMFVNISITAFPPTPVLMSVFRRILQDEVPQMILIIPLWEGAAWWNTLTVGRLPSFLRLSLKCCLITRTCC